MRMAWLLLIIAGFCELGFIGFLQKAISSGKKWYNLFSFASMAISLILLAIVTKTIALSVAYAVWTGIGAISSVLYGIFFLGEDRQPLKFVFIGCILFGVIGLRLFGA
ncbi:hypothetical protein FC24_GL001962 [Loigolactobacillus rennini DSM 20253]|uniref:Uncharacterized protein n=2 Tax=Loigolactobacillus rennini TaxID=238013 RepID=A0A0R2D5U1_9LACO|nr:hypothetical protein FC24_GL001962 [Loigolactobacillus rennini DSM 20253]